MLRGLINQTTTLKFTDETEVHRPNTRYLEPELGSLSLTFQKINNLTTVSQDFLNINANMTNSMNTDILNYL